MKDADIERLYVAYSKLIYGYLLKCTGDESLSEELTQETFYQAMISMERFQGKCKESVWLCQIAKHIWYKNLRKEKKYTYVPEDQWETLIPPCDSVETSVFEQRDKLTLYKYIRLLPKDMQEVVYLRLTGDLSFGEIGEIMDRSEVWARTNYYRAKERLMKEVNKDET